MTITKRNYIKGDYEVITDQNIGSFVVSTWSYVKLDGYFKYLFTDVVVKVASTSAVVPAGDYELLQDDRYTGYEAESGGSGKTVYAQIKITNASYAGIDLLISCNNFGSYTDNEISATLIDAADGQLLTVRWWHKSRYAQYMSTQLKNSLTTDGTTAGHLIDSGEDFSTLTVGDIVHNETDDTFAAVTAIATGDLTLSDDIMVSGDVYSIYDEPTPGYGWVEYAGQTISDAESPFNGMILEDLVGDHRFIRAWEVSGNEQADAFQGHTFEHASGILGNDALALTGGASNMPRWGTNTGTISIGSDGVNGTPRTASETRSINISMVPIVKIKSIFA